MALPAIRNALGRPARWRALIQVAALFALAPLTRAAEVDVVPQALSTNVSEVIRLAESGLEESVILAFIETARAPFRLSADQVIYLDDIGLASTIVTAMLHQDTLLRAQNLETGILVEPAAPSALLTNAPASASPPVWVTNAPPQVGSFYESLAPYGTWIELEGMGWCWQPRVVAIDRAWRPYWHGGRWIYTDSDWYWYSEYSWGWAAFHYGRWHRHPHWGWLWFPDLVWAPAWVCWRYSDTHCGWAPLPLGAHFVVGHGFHFNGVSVGVNFDFHLGLDAFTFVDLGHFHERHPHLHGVPPARVADVCGNTTVVNNFKVGRDNAVINRGVPVGGVAIASGREIHPVETREGRPEADGRSAREHLVLDRKAPVLYRPPLQGLTRPSPVRAQRVDPQHPIVRPPARSPAIHATPGEGRATLGQPTTPAPRAPGRTPQQPPPTQPRTQPVRPAPRQPLPAYPGPPSPVAPARTLPPSMPARPPASPPRAESPKGRDQRISNGRAPGRVAPPSPTSPRAPSGPGHGDHGKQRP